jgi:hypothetical protein
MLSKQALSHLVEGVVLGLLVWRGRARLAFAKEYGGELMHPSERGKGKNWSQWKKGTYKPKSKGPYDFS